MSTPPYPGSGGWRARQWRDRTILYDDIPFLASEKYTVKRSGATFKQAVSTAAVNEVQTLAASSATAGTFTLTFNGQTTAALPYNATATQIAQALQALSNVGVGQVSASGGPAQSTNVVLTFIGDYAGRDVPLITVNKANLTGGAAAAVTQTTKGSPLGVTEIKRGTFVIPDTANPGYYKAWATGDTIVTDPGTAGYGISGYLMESINVADGDVTEGILINGSVLAARVTPSPVPSAILTAVAGRITFQ